MLPTLEELKRRHQAERAEQEAFRAKWFDLLPAGCVLTKDELEAQWRAVDAVRAP